MGLPNASLLHVFGERSEPTGVLDGRDLEEPDVDVLGERELLVGTWIGEFENIRMKRYFEIKLASTGKTLLKATWNLVCIEIVYSVLFYNKNDYGNS